MTQQILEDGSILSCSHTELEDAVRRRLVLCQQLCCHQFLPRQFHISHTCKGHLLGHVVTLPLTTHHVVQHERRLSVVEQQTGEQRRLDGNLPADGEGHTPHGGIFAQTNLVVQFDEIVGMIGKAGMELGATRGEVPVVLAVVVGLELIIDKAFIHDIVHLLLTVANGLMIREHRMEIVVVPVGPDADIKVADIEIEEFQHAGVLVAGNAIELIAVFEKVDLAVAEGIRHRRLEKAHRPQRPQHLPHQSFTQSQRHLHLSRNLRAERQLGIHLQGYHLLAVETRSHIDRRRRDAVFDCRF